MNPDNTTGRAQFIRQHECAFPAKWQQIEDDRTMFKVMLTRIEKKIDEIDEKVDHHHKRMFVDNGTPSVQTRLTEGVAKFSALDARITDLETQPRRLLAWAVGIAAILGTVAGGVAWALKNVRMT